MYEGIMYVYYDKYYVCLYYQEKLSGNCLVDLYKSSLIKSEFLIMYAKCMEQSFRNLTAIQVAEKFLSSYESEFCV
jgi:hypothetical protein